MSRDTRDRHVPTHSFPTRRSSDLANVAGADINDEAGEAVVAASGGKAAYFRCDIAQEEDVKALVAQTLAAFGGLDGAFNNAAIPQAGLPLESARQVDRKRTRLNSSHSCASSMPSSD